VKPRGPAQAAEVRDRFTAGLGFALDEFQVRALDAIDAERSVVVAAPTGAGKTVVAEYAVARGLAEGGKVFYTTPLKALSNQKFGDLVRQHGAARVGLLTGDNSINGDAPVVVMTTEVLRNMIYAGSPALGGLRYVVLDEVHYLEDPSRGPVWEEVIIHAPPEVGLVCLSATVSNAEDFADWVQTVRGETEAVIEERRPVELRHLYMVGDRGSEELLVMPTFVDGRPNPEAADLDRRVGGWSPARAGRRVHPRSRHYSPRRVEVVTALAERGMLPAIYFIFSRAGCDEAMSSCLHAGLRLTSEAERDRIHDIAAERVSALCAEDLEALGGDTWMAALGAGLAAHHAGMVPPMKEAVEACFAAGLIKVVFATETLALGINMPARTVVVEKLTKFSGEHHEFLTPGEYTQLTGRAGRRGIDSVGYAVVLWNQFVPFGQVAGLASKRTYALTSAFRPTYNMAANLIRRYAPDQAHHLLNLSFAQYSVDADVVRLETALERARADEAAARRAATCERGDVFEYRRSLGVGTAGEPPAPRARDEVAAALERVHPGDVLLVGGVPGGKVAVLSTAHRAAGALRLSAVTVSNKRVTLTAADFASPPGAVGTVVLPEPYRPRSKAFINEVAAGLRRVRVRRPDTDGWRRGDEPAGGGRPRGPHGDRSRRHVDGSRGYVEEQNPVASCPDVRAHLRAAALADRLAAGVDRLERQILGRTESLARQLDRVVRVLRSWGYVDGVNGWGITAAGERLARLYHECDLLVAEALEEGLLDELDPAALAGLVSTFTYEARGPAGTGPAPSLPSRAVRDRWGRVESLAAELNRIEEEAGLPATRRPEAGFVAAACAWAGGENLAGVIAGEEISGGDFVRNVKQLIDLLRQIGEVATSQATRQAARAAGDLLLRGVVAASSVVTVDARPPEAPPGP